VNPDYYETGPALYYLPVLANAALIRDPALPFGDL